MLTFSLCNMMGGEDEWLGLLACAMENSCNFNAVNWGLPCILNFMQRVMLLTAVMTERCPDLKSFTSLSSTCKQKGTITCCIVI